MYYEVYVDVLFVENLWMDALLLLLTGWMDQAQTKPWRVFSAACAGSLGACLITVLSAQLPGLGYFLGNLAIAGLMVRIAFPGWRHFLLRLLSLYLESFMLNGLLRYLEQFHPLAGAWFAIFGGGSFLFLSGAEKLMLCRNRRRKLLYPVTLTCGACRISLEALYDTGNGLYDPISGKPISILSGERLAELLEGAGEERLPRMVPYTTISQSGVLQVYTLDFMEIGGRAGGRVLKRPMLACMPGEKRQYPLILHRDLLPS